MSSTSDSDRGFVTPSTGSDGDHTYLRLCSAIHTNIAHLTTAVTTYQDRAAFIGTLYDTLALRQELAGLVQEVKEVMRTTTIDLRQLRRAQGETATENVQRRAQYTKLAKHVAALADRFSKLCQVTAEREAQCVPLAQGTDLLQADSDDANDPPDERAGLLPPSSDVPSTTPRAAPLPQDVADVAIMATTLSCLATEQLPAAPDPPPAALFYTTDDIEQREAEVQRAALQRARVVAISAVVCGVMLVIIALVLVL